MIAFLIGLLSVQCEHLPSSAPGTATYLKRLLFAVCVVSCDYLLKTTTLLIGFMLHQLLPQPVYSLLLLSFVTGRHTHTTSYNTRHLFLLTPHVSGSFNLAYLVESRHLWFHHITFFFEVVYRY